MGGGLAGLFLVVSCLPQMAENLEGLCCFPCLDPSQQQGHRSATHPVCASVHSPALPEDPRLARMCVSTLGCA